jgi:hypothetical protein
MNRNKLILAIVTVLLIGSVAGVLARYKSIQRLGEPGVKTRPIPGSKNLVVVLPENVPGYAAAIMQQHAVVTNTLPKDTSYGLCRYTAPDDFYTDLNVVLMGSDRASMHKPQFCLTGNGWTIHQTEITQIPIEQPVAYDLSVIKITASGKFTQGGREQTYGGIYVYWFVADNALSADAEGWDRMWSMARDLFTTGVLQRWAYISYFAPCMPGQEEQTYERVKKLIAATVPEFQTSLGSKTADTRKL